MLIKIHNKGMSDDDLTKEIAMNHYLRNTFAASRNTGMNVRSAQA